MIADSPMIVSAALLLREDGHVLLVRHRSDEPQFGGLWSLPMDPVAEDEVAEDALQRALRDRLHVTPGSFEFADTVYVSGAMAGRFIINVFKCWDWDGEPRFSEEHYEDAAWVQPGSHGSLAVVPELRQWLATALDGGAATDPGAIAATLDEARVELVSAYEAIPGTERDQPLDEEWSPLDVLAHAASVESYYAAESRRLLGRPGHTWRAFNAAQWEDDFRSRPAEPEKAVRTRLDATREQTSVWLSTLTDEQLAAYGNHAERGAVTVGDRIEKIARHDREHADQLRRMLQTAQQRAGAGGR